MSSFHKKWKRLLCLTQKIMFVFLSFFKTEFSRVNANNVRFFCLFLKLSFPVSKAIMFIFFGFSGKIILESGKHYPISQFKLIYAWITFCLFFSAVNIMYYPCCRIMFPFSRRLVSFLKYNNVCFLFLWFICQQDI